MGHPGGAGAVAVLPVAVGDARGGDLQQGPQFPGLFQVQHGVPAVKNLVAVRALMAERESSSSCG